MKTEDKPHYYHFSFMDDYWLMSVPSKAQSWDDVKIIYDSDCMRKKSTKKP